MEKIKFKKIIFDLVENNANDMELGKLVRRLTADYKQLKEEKKKKTKLPKVDKSKIENYSKKKKKSKNKLEYIPEPSIMTYDLKVEE